MRAIVAGVFERAKEFWTVGIASKILVAIAGFVLSFVSEPPFFSPFIILALEIVASVGFYAADYLKNAGEPMLTRLDFEYGLGWTIPQEQIEECRSDYGSFEALGNKIRRGEDYFASSSPIGLARLKDAILESALYTRDIAKGARTVVIAVTALVALSFFTVLSTGLYRLLAHGKQHSGVEFATDALILLVALDLVPLALKYDVLVKAAGHLRDALPGAHGEDKVMPIVIEYQLARASAPLLPTFEFLKRRLPLSTIWSDRHPK